MYYYHVFSISSKDNMSEETSSLRSVQNVLPLSDDELSSYVVYCRPGGTYDPSPTVPVFSRSCFILLLIHQIYYHQLCICAVDN